MPRYMEALIRTCIIYARFSSDQQNPMSAEDQIAECREYAKSKGWVVVGVESDEAVRGGADLSLRPGLQRILARTKDGDVDAVIVHELSRFSRDPYEVGNLFGALRTNTRYIVGVDRGVFDLRDTDDSRRAFDGIFVAQGETDRISYRTRRGLRARVRRKRGNEIRNPGGIPAFGYKRSPILSETHVALDGRPLIEGVILVEDERAAAIVRRMFELFDAGFSMNAIARTLNAEGLPSPRAGQERKGDAFNGFWCAQTIRGILSNQKYTGTYVYGERPRTGDRLPSGKRKQERAPDAEVERFEEAVPAIVSPDLFARVQAELHERAQKNPRGRPTKYLLSGFLVCGECGRKMSIGLHIAERPFYRCDFAHKHHKCRNKTLVSEERLRRKVLEVLEATRKDPSRLQALVDQHNRSIVEVNKRESGRVEALKVKRKDIKKALDQLTDAIEQGGRNVPHLVARAKTRTAELDEVERQISDLQAELKPLLLPRAFEDFSEGDASLFEEDVAARRRVTQDVQKIVVHHDGGMILFFVAASLFEPVTSYGFDLDEQDEVAPLKARRERHMVGAANVSAGRDPFVVEDGGSTLYGATVKMPPGFDFTQDDLPETSSVSKRSQRPQRDSKAKFRDGTLQNAGDRGSGVQASPSGRAASPRSHVVQPGWAARRGEDVRPQRASGCRLG